MGAVRYHLRSMLRERWLGALGLAATVAVAGAVVLVLVAGTVRTASAPDRYAAARGDLYDTQMEQAEGRPLTAEVEALPAVDSVVAATFFFGGIRPADGNGDPIEGITFAGTPEGFGGEIVDGRAPDPEVPGEFVASDLWIDTADAELGDEFQLVTITQRQAEVNGFDAEPRGPSFTATLVGEYERPSAGLQDDYPVAVFPVSLLDEGPIGVSATESLVSLVDGADVADLRRQLDTLPAGADLSLDPAEWVPVEVRDAVGTQANGLAVLTLIAGVAALVVVAQIATRQARLSDAHRRSLSALGLTRGQLLAEALGRIALPALIGALVASALAVLFSGVFPVDFVRGLEPDPGVRFDARVHLAGAAGLVVGLLAWVGLTLVGGAVGERRRRPSSVVEGLAPKIARPKAAMGLRFAFARHPRDAGAIGTPAVGLLFVVATLVAAGTFAASLDDLLDDPARWGSTFDAGVGQGGGQVSDDVVATLSADADVAALTLMGNVRVSAGTTGLDVTGMEPVRGDLGLRVLEGGAPVASDEIVLGRNAARDLGVGVGDDLTVRGPSGDRTLHVVGLAVIPSVEGGEGLGEGGLVTYDTLRALDPAATLSVLTIDFRPGAPADTAARLSADTGVRIGPQDVTSVIINLRRVRSVPYVIGGLLAALALLSLASLMTVALRHRRRELAVLRALGSDRRWIGRVVTWHAVAFTAAIVALGVPFGIVAGRWTFRFLADRIGAAGDTAVPWALVLTGFVVLASVAELVGQVTVRRRALSVVRQLAVE
ncbi:MAG TPA: ABC transporter permease [Acidimicrobiales bacterium]